MTDYVTFLASKRADVALIAMSRQRIDNTLYAPDRRARLARHVRLYQRAMKYREEGTRNA